MGDKVDLLAIIEDELRWHPRMGPQDLRKLVAQSVFGVDHLLDDPDRFRRALRREWDRLPPPTEAEPAVQRIDPDGRTARLHLVPCRVAGVSLDALGDLLVGQRRKAGRRHDDLARWREVVALAAAGRLPFSARALAGLEEIEDLPHHSAAYGFAAYRVVNDVRDPSIADRLAAWGLQ